MEARQAAGAAAGGGGALAGLPVGFRFHPTDEELLLHYLRRKALACSLPADIIPVADLARLHPWDLVPPGDADEERFLFHLPATRCWRRAGGARRAAGTGVWRASGKAKLVVSPRCGRPVGEKRTLVFCHRGGKRTDWLMHEYRLLLAGLLLPHNPSSAAPHVMNCHGDGAAAGAEDWVVCRIFKRTKPGHGGRGGEEASPSSSASSCVTDNSSDGDDEEEGEQSSSSNSGDGSCSVASNRGE